MYGPEASTSSRRWHNWSPSKTERTHNGSNATRMGNATGPLIVRHRESTFPESTSYVRPGSHSHNVGRRRPIAQVKHFTALHWVRLLLLVLGLSALGYYGYSLSDQYVYQAYQNWAFDQEIAGRPSVTFADYVREQTPFGFLVGTKSAKPVSVASAPSANGMAPARPEEGSLLGRVSIARLNLSAMVREGVDAKTLSVAVGHVPSTALAGQDGNFAIAAHRDTLFRALKDIHKDDVVTFQSPAGTYAYRVVATKIVKPSDVSVLQPDGGGLIPGPQHPDKLLTMITCYPFYYVGSAPKRFIVEAELINSDPGAKFSAEEAQNASPPPPARLHKIHKIKP